jgi:hypothetical protein
MKTRIIISIALVAIFILTTKLFGLFYSPITGVATAAQLNDSLPSYALAKFIRDGNVERIAFWTLILALLCVWASPMVRFARGLRKELACVAFAMLMLSSCTPYKTLDVVEVKSNETAWAIPLDAMSKDGQVKFNSVDFLNQKKVASKRIMVDKVSRSTGRMWYDLEWIPATRVITVDRSLVTRQWTDGDPGTSKDDEGIGVVTRDSVKLRVGLTITASIDEDDASTYLYYHGARPLHEVMDQNIRSFAVAELTKEYSLLSLNEAQVQGDTIYTKLFADAAKAFKPKGILIQYLGNAEGLTYGDPTVQAAINKRYLAEQDAKTAEQEQAAQKIRNTTKVFNAQAEADAAKKLFDAKEAASFQNDLQIRMITAQAQKTMAEHWNGGMPQNVLPGNSPMLMQFGTDKK